MSKYETDTTQYILVRKKLNNGKQEDVVIYNDYNGTFNQSPDISRATRFENKERAEQLAQAQNQVSKVMGNGYEYNVIEENTVREMTTEESETEATPENDQEATQ